MLTFLLRVVIILAALAVTVVIMHALRGLNNEQVRPLGRRRALPSRRSAPMPGPGHEGIADPVEREAVCAQFAQITSRLR